MKRIDKQRAGKREANKFLWWIVAAIVVILSLAARLRHTRNERGNAEIVSPQPAIVTEAVTNIAPVPLLQIAATNQQPPPTNAISPADQLARWVNEGNQLV